MRQLVDELDQEREKTKDLKNAAVERAETERKRQEEENRRQKEEKRREEEIRRQKEEKRREEKKIREEEQARQTEITRKEEERRLKDEKRRQDERRREEEKEKEERRQLDYKVFPNFCKKGTVADVRAYLDGNPDLLNCSNGEPLRQAAVANNIALLQFFLRKDEIQVNLKGLFI